MRRLLTLRLLTPCIAGLLLAVPAWAHERWIEVEPFFAAVPGRAKVYLATGEALHQAELRPERSRGKFVRFELLSSAGRRALLPLLQEDRQPIAIIEGPGVPAGTSAVVLDTAPIDIELEAEPFQRYLFSEGLIDVLAVRAQRRQEDQPGRERYTRHLKALVRAGAAPGDAATRPAGQELEIVPLRDPYALAPGAALTLQVLFRGRPLPDRAMTCANRHRSRVTSSVRRTDRDGRLSCTLSRPGDWLAALVHMEPSGQPDVDWRSYWASLSFSLPDPPARQGGPR